MHICPGCCMNNYSLPVVGQTLFQITTLSTGEGNRNSFKELKKTSAEGAVGGIVGSEGDLAVEKLLSLCRKP